MCVYACVGGPGEDQGRRVKAKSLTHRISPATVLPIVQRTQERWDEGSQCGGFNRAVSIEVSVVVSIGRSQLKSVRWFQVHQPHLRHFLTKDSRAEGVDQHTKHLLPMLLRKILDAAHLSRAQIDLC
jgi:hypothetical protein